MIRMNIMMIVFMNLVNQVHLVPSVCAGRLSGRWCSVQLLGGESDFAATELLSGNLMVLSDPEVGFFEVTFPPVCLAYGSFVTYSHPS